MARMTGKTYVTIHHALRNDAFGERVIIYCRSHETALEMVKHLNSNFRVEGTKILNYEED